jgi:thioesterase domain-containing protein
MGQRLLQQHGQAPQLDRETITRMYALFKNHAESMQRFIPGEAPLHVALFGAAGPEFAIPSHEDYQRLTRQSQTGAPARGWDDYARHGVTCYPIPGDHYGMILSESVRSLAQAMDICLAHCVENSDPAPAIQ